MAREVGMGGSGAGEENKADDGGDAAVLDADFIAFRFRWERKQGGGEVACRCVTHHWLVRLR